MKTLMLALVSAAVFPAMVSAATYDLDASHSVVSFKIRHLGISKVQGSFSDFSGTITADPAKLGTTGADITVNVTSLSTGNDDRDTHLKSPDFFDVESHPTMTFTSTKAMVVDGGEFQLVGDLTIAGVTKPVTLDVEFNGVATDPWGNSKIAFTASTEINRKDFGLTWNKTLEAGGLLVGEDVDISIEVEATQRKS